jgi:hypothetical protein
MKSATQTQRRALRITGIIGILAAISATVADIALQYSPGGQYATNLNVLTIPLWSILLGYYLGIFAIPLLAVGYWQVSQALKPAGKWFSLPFFLITAYTTAYGPAFHGSFAAMALMVQARQISSAQTQNVLTHLLGTYGLFTTPLAVVLLLNFLIGWAWYVIAVVFKRTLLPKWMALFNPFLLSLAITLFYYSNLVPFLDNLLFPVVLNLPHVIFFTLTTILLWNAYDQNYSVLPETMLKSHRIQ